MPLEKEKLEDLEKRTMDFKCLQLPGQPMMGHMGTNYLVNDLYQAMKMLDRENLELQNQIQNLQWELNRRP